MDRDRDRRYDRDRDRDRGDGYRAIRRTPPRETSYRGPPPSADTYTPSDRRGGTTRDRSPSPRRRRSRSPPPGPRRSYSPRRDDDRRDRDRDRERDFRYRSPAKDQRYARSPPRRERSRSRDRKRSYSPMERDRSPRRERNSPRYQSPRRNYPPPERRERSRSPYRRDERDEKHSSSVSTSRRSSPPAANLHPNRMNLMPPTASEGRSPGPPTSPAAFSNRNTPSRPIAPPTGPAASSHLPPTRPANSILQAPSQPRGGGGMNARGRGYGGSPGYGGGPGYGGSPGYSPREFHNSPMSYRGGIRRGDFPPRGPSSRPPPPFRGPSSSSTYSRSQRFDDATPPAPPSGPSKYLADLPQTVPGGVRRPSVTDPQSEAKIQHLEEQAEKLRLQIADRQRAKRQAVHEWRRMVTEGESVNLRGMLAEENLRRAKGEELEEVSL